MAAVSIDSRGGLCSLGRPVVSLYLLAESWFVTREQEEFGLSALVRETPLEHLHVL